MRVKIFSKILFMSFIWLFGNSGNVVRAEEQDSGLAESTIEDLSIIAATGLGGAVLGLSTLPFKDRPSQHLRHILVGGSIGIIVGVAIIAWGQATKSRDVSFEEASNSPSSLNSFDQISWRNYQGSSTSSRKLFTYQQQYTPYFFYFTKTF